MAISDDIKSALTELQGREAGVKRDQAALQARHDALTREREELEQRLAKAEEREFSLRMLEYASPICTIVKKHQFTLEELWLPTLPPLDKGETTVVDKDIGSRHFHDDQRPWRMFIGQMNRLTDRLWPLLCDYPIFNLPGQTKRGRGQPSIYFDLLTGDSIYSCGFGYDFRQGERDCLAKSHTTVYINIDDETAFSKECGQAWRWEGDIKNYSRAVTLYGGNAFQGAFAWRLSLVYDIKDGFFVGKFWYSRPFYDKSPWGLPG